MSSPTRKLGGLFGRVGLTYSFGTQNIRTDPSASRQYFEFINFQGLDGPNTFDGIQTSAVIPSYTFNSIDHPITPSRGKSLFISTQFAGLGGTVRMIEPTVDFKMFRAGIKRGHVIGFHALGRFITGYGGRYAPPFNRFYMGGENDIRGFEIWGISPVAFMPSVASINVLNDDGSARQQKIIVDGAEVLRPVTQQVPVYQMIFPGGDTQLVGNFEYRSPIAGPVTLAGFFDAGVNRISRPNQLSLNQGRLDELNGQFPQAAFGKQIVVSPGTQKMRSSTGVELQIMMPVVNAPFRLYWAYNPQILEDFIIPPVVTERSMFPNNRTFIESIRLYGQAYPPFEKRRTFRFTISRTF
jgi:outer membrane protein insertion porin family